MNPLVGTTALDPDALTGHGPERSEDDPPESRFGHVIPWSGPAGWRQSRPTLHAKRIRDAIGRDAGFSFIELMVALLVLAILLAVAIPTFLGTTGAANDRSAQSNLNTALVEAKAQFQNAGQTYLVGGVQDAAGLAALLSANQPSLTFRAGSTGTSTTQGSSGNLSTISEAVSADGNGIVLAAYSVPGDCFYVLDNAIALTGTTASVAPYSGTTAVTSTATTAPAGTIGLPVGAGISYVEVKGDTTKTDCNSYSPRTNGSPATVRYLTSGFPN